MAIAYFFIAFLLSFMFCLLLLRYIKLHEHLSADFELDGVQKFHVRAVPRIGGLAICGALVLTVPLMAALESSRQWPAIAMLCVAALPCFLGGFAEDLLKIGLIKTRLACMAVSALLLFLGCGIGVFRLDVSLLDQALLQYSWLAAAFTVFAVVGMINAINLIDGYNGLAVAVSLIILGSISYVGVQVGDRMVVIVAMTMIGAGVGFLLWNWPRGLIFLGDGGAYLYGFVIAALVVALVQRHPQISAWYAAVLLIYPVMETVFTIHRRMQRRHHVGLPDAAHLHQLIYKRMMRWAVGSSHPHHRTMRNSMTSPYLWLLSSLGVIPATILWSNTHALQLALLGFAVLYIWLYRSIARFRSPRWMIYRRPAYLIEKE
ncbi:UDP-N-acetylmuramyl pentapeptide phosphotransferase/UDP-N-acetylglucosamine-1-phosphate transferase [Andreprevotia lacus DSM 23236]|jgi:UDP-N-acetylmuramyl pentapeptide phosphotransferase/UDP-N-acetylglucosamine-1-phosphate transferase|uniref:UDP-N-acetylmuramyl pentapeptide phosphotransferase/UDP-N-acetylglucosamine-1-phosphate transferase n=1 Tax=Andreprevotia lacus DSM 23236 TaxID=1121001 RepID=A0A1W1Y2E2_9NEIS|nr:glycosyltransferase [Andreprevotia lacus]SMC29961.1 UDP-N-acetylmuramyl pentapeptide phosphotransferase/UDP-N-acetylglucosamine-1-phosphate transferase [Andreprevotia lacus DSM 23236]